MLVLNYSPGQCDDPRLLEEMTVAESRRRLIDDLVAAVAAEVGRETHQHQLIVGPRGSGKTHVLAIVAHRICSTKLNETVLPIQLPEEVTVRHPADLIIKTIERLGARLDANDCGLGARAQEVKRTCARQVRHLMGEKDDDEALVAAMEMADELAALTGRLLVPIVENLDYVLYSGPRRSRTTKEGPQWNLRRHLMKTRSILLVASASTLLAEVKAPDAPFFDFFREHALEELSPDEMVELFTRRLDLEIARGKNDERTLRRLHAIKADFRSREKKLRGVLALAGGLPRFGHLIFDLVVQSDVDSIMGMMYGFLDQQSAYFQSWLNPKNLPEGEAEVLDFIACSNRALTPSQISEGLRDVPLNAVSTLLGRLIDRGLVRAHREEGRSAWYDVGEPLFRVWRLFRTSSAERERLLLVAELVSALFEPAEMMSERAALSASDPSSGRLVLLDMALHMSLAQSTATGSKELSLSEGPSAAAISDAEEEFLSGNVKKAVAIMTQAVERLEGEGPTERLSLALARLSEYYLIAGDQKEAIASADKGFEIAVQRRSDLGLASCIGSRGHVHFRLGDNDAALKAYDVAEPLFRKVGSHIGRANCIRHRGNVQFFLGDNDAALKAYDDAETLYRKVGDDLGQANCICNRGDVHFRLGDNDAALKAYDEAETLFRKVGSDLGRANCIASRGDVQFSLGDNDAVLKAYDEAEPLFRQVGDDLGRANCIRSRGDMHFRLGDNDAALKAYDEAEALYQRVGDDLGRASCIRDRGQVHFWLGDNDTALKAYNDAEPLYRKVCNSNGTATFLLVKGRSVLRAGRADEGFDLMLEGLSLHRQISHKYRIRYDVKAIVNETTLLLASLDKGDVERFLRKLETLAPLISEHEDVRAAFVRLVTALYRRFPPEAFLGLLGIVEAMIPDDFKGLLRPARLAGERKAGLRRKSLPEETEEVRRAVREFEKVAVAGGAKGT